MQKERMSNIELLRIISMFMVIMIHLFTKSNVLWEMGLNQGVYYIAWFLYGLCMTGVNCYVIISGFFSIESKFRPEKIIKIYVQVLFYSVTLALAAKFLLRLDLTSSIVAVFLPVTRQEYWFATIYIGLCCLMPFLNILVRAMERKQFQCLLIMGTILLSVIPTFLYAQSWLNEGGAYGILWFMFLYLIGAYIRKYYRAGNKKAWICYAAAILVVPVTKYIILFIGTMQNIISMDKVSKISEVFYRFNSLPALIASVAIFICFAGIKFDRTIKWINIVSGATFGVYLIHNNRNIAHYLWDTLKVSDWLIVRQNIIAVVGIGLAVFLACAVVEIIRSSLFRLLKVDYIISKVSALIERKVNSWLNKI